MPYFLLSACLRPQPGGAAAREFQRLFLSLHARDLLAAEPALARLDVPTLVVWGTGDKFFPDERAPELTAALRRHWEAHP